MVNYRNIRLAFIARTEYTITVRLYMRVCMERKHVRVYVRDEDADAPLAQKQRGLDSGPLNRFLGFWAAAALALLLLSFARLFFVWLYKYIYIYTYVHVL